MDQGPLIRLTDIAKEYVTDAGTTPVLRGLTMDVARGSFTALQGPSGSGKSTLLHILGLLDRPSSGRYELDGRDVSTLPDDTLSEIRNRMFGFVFQSFHLIPYVSALENVLLPGLYGPESRRVLAERAREILALVGLADRANYRPGQLSGGQQQRVALARALLGRPACIFADEPTGQLDSGTSREIMELLTDINAQGTTVVMVTHDAQTASFAKSTILLRDGRLDPGS